MNLQINVVHTVLQETFEGENFCEFRGLWLFAKGHSGVVSCSSRQSTGLPVWWEPGFCRVRFVDDQYVDGLTLTHGTPSSRQHIWTFASGRFTDIRSSIRHDTQCPCDNGNTFHSPPFVGNDYFCESVLAQYNYQWILYPNATLWDGQVCEGGGTCCQFNNPPWFTKNLANSITDDIELRLCLLEAGYCSDIALEQLELYVQWTLSSNNLTLLVFKNLLCILVYNIGKQFPGKVLQRVLCTCHAVYVCAHNYI